MSNDEPEIIPPTKHALVKREESGSVSTGYDDTVPQPRGVVATALTGFHARIQARAYREIAENIRAQKDALDAETARRDSTIKLLRKTGELYDIKDILALDKAERAAERAASTRVLLQTMRSSTTTKTSGRISDGLRRCGGNGKSRKRTRSLRKRSAERSLRRRDWKTRSA
jgi:hypothetical protein